MEANSRLEDAKTEWESALKASAFADEAHFLQSKV
ncbi:putative exonuclease SbcC domain protein, partial [Vibrio parahaemolyticus V-223/04]